jgi:putative oxidoreductase
MKTSKVIYWIARLAAALIMLQTLYFKFSGAEESIYIFKTVGMEPWGRYGVGVMELIAAVLLMMNSTAWIGAALGASLMAGAIGMHLTILGISVSNGNGETDGGQLFIYAVIVLIACAYVLFVNKTQILQTVARARGNY